MNIETLNALLGIIASLLTIMAVLVGLVIAIIGHPPTHSVILGGALIALLAMALGFVLGVLPLISPVDTRYTIANALALGGLILTGVVWLSALSVSLQLKQWVWVFGLLLGGLVPYAFAVYYAVTTVFTNTLLVGVVLFLAGIVPGLFGLFGPPAGTHQSSS